LSDESLRDYFSEFGQILDCHSLPPKNNNPQLNTKAAFIRFSRKSEAIAAIEACDKKRSFDGIERTMDVRIAEGKQEKPSMTSGFVGQTHAVRVPHREPASQAFRYHQQSGQPSLPIPAPPQPLRQPRTIGAWTEYYTSDGRPYYHNAITNSTVWEAPAEFRASIYPSGGSHYTTPQSVYLTGSPPSVDAKGPSGANLFIFHVPTEWSDNDLYQHFAPYGNLVSFRIAREKETNRPKGFGFVSYDTSSSASAAVSAMNGFMVSNGKRLKVSVKKGEENGPMGINRAVSRMVPPSYYPPY
jgi:RNA recognition motif-containing protein